MVLAGKMVRGTMETRYGSLLKGDKALPLVPQMNTKSLSVAAENGPAPRSAIW